MGKFNFGNWLNDNIFKTNEMRQISSVFGKLTNGTIGFVSGMMQNMQNIGQGVGNMLNSSFLMPVLLISAGIFVAIRLRIL